jgi:O-antigen/teichoic acid export membrane protein
MLLRNVIFFFDRRIDDFVIASQLGTTALGNYYVAKDISVQLTTSIVMPLSRALFPGYAKLTHDPSQLAAMYRTVLGLVAIVSLPIGFGISVVATDFVLLLVGEKWAAAIPLIETLAIFGAVSEISNTAGPMFIATGRVRAVTLLRLLQLLMLTPLLVLAGIYGGITDIAASRTAVAILSVPLVLYFVTRVLPVSPGEIVGVIWRPLAACGIMVGAVRALHLEAVDNHALTLGMDVLVGAATFVGAGVLLWALAGSPDGPERTALQFVTRALNPAPKT